MAEGTEQDTLESPDARARRLQLTAQAELELEQEQSGGGFLQTMSDAFFNGAGDPTTRDVIRQGASSLFPGAGIVVGDSPAETLTNGLTTAGSFALPWARGIGAAPPGSRALRSLLQTLKQSVAGAAGDAAGHEVAETVGLTPDTGLDAKAARFALNTGAGTALGALAEWATRGRNRLAYNPARSLDDPQVETARGYAERSGFDTDPLEKQVEFANKRARNLDDSIGGELMMGAGESNYEIAAAEKFKKQIPVLREEGVFQQAQSVEDLGVIANQQIEAINEARARAVTEMGGAPITVDDLAGPIAEINERITQLRKTSGTEPIAAGLAGEMNSIVGDLHVPALHGYPSQPKTVADAVDMIQNLNEQRRVLMQEFNSGNVAARTKGDVLNHEGALEAIQRMQDGLAKAIDKATGSTVFSTLNARQSAYYGLAEQAAKFGRGVQSGKVTKPAGRMIQNAGQEDVGPGGFLADAAVGNKSGALKGLFDWLTGAREASPGMRRALRVEDMSANAPQNIRDLTSLNQQPAALTPAQTPRALNAVPQVAISQLGGLLNSMNGPGGTPAQAQQPPPVFPRDTNALLQNKEAFLATVAQISPDLLDDVKVALAQPNPSRRETMLMTLAQGIPQLFEPSEYYSQWGGKIHDPKERPIHLDRLRTENREGKFDNNHLSRAMAAVNVDGTILPAPPPVQPQGTPVLQGPAGPQRQYSY